MVGGGGHASACLDVILSEGQFEVIGLVDPNLEIGSIKYGLSVLGGDEAMSSLRSKCSNAFVAIGQISDSSSRRRASQLVREHNFFLPTIKAPSAHIALAAELDVGCIAMHRVMVGTGSSIGEMTILNNGAHIDHGCSIGKFVHVSTGAIVNGDCVIEDDCFLGSGSIVHEGVKIGARSLISAGAIVRRDLPPGSKYFG